MREMTKESLSAALAGESQAHIKYLAFADQAAKEGKPNVARLFRAISRAEQVHATNHLRELGGIGKTTDNLSAAIGGETFEVNEMYAAYMAVAELQGEQGALRSMNYANEAEKLHAMLYTDAKQTVEGSADRSADEIYVCPVCGFTHVGTPPDQCPVCKTKHQRFMVF